MFRRCDVNAVRERSAPQIRVEQRNDAANLRDPQPDSDILRPVRHQQAYAVAFADAVRQRPACILVRPFAQTAIRQAVAIRKQGGGFAGLRSPLLDYMSKDTIRMPGNGRCQLQRADPRLRRRLALMLRSVYLVFRHAVLPASTVTTVPVMFFDLQPNRNSTAFATSSISVKRRSALRRAICSRCSSVSACVISVSTNPGATEFTFTPMRPTSR